MNVIKAHTESHLCAIAKCKKQVDALFVKQKQFLKEITELMHNTSLKPDVRDKRLKKLALEFNKSVQKRNEVDCRLKHCYERFHSFLKAKIEHTQKSPTSPEWSRRIAEHYTKALKKGKITRADILKANAIILENQIQQGLNKASPVLNNLADTQNCVKKHCGNLKQKIETQKKDYVKELNKIHSNTKMTDKEKLAKLEEATIKFYDSPDRHKMIDCELGICRAETEKTIRETINLVKTIPNPPKQLTLIMKMFDDMLKNNTFTKENIIKNDLKMMKEMGYKMPI